MQKLRDNNNKYSTFNTDFNISKWHETYKSMCKVPVINYAISTKFFEIFHCSQVIFVICPYKNYLFSILYHFDLTWITLDILSHCVNTWNSKHFLNFRSMYFLNHWKLFKFVWKIVFFFKKYTRYNIYTGFKICLQQIISQIQ